MPCTLCASEHHTRSHCPWSQDSTRTASVDRAYHWLPITPETPRGVKMQLINRKAGVAAYGTLGTDPFFWTHYAPLPTFRDEA